MFTVILMAISLSLDSFIIGITYGAIKIKLSFLYKFIIALISFIITFCTLTIGTYLKNILPDIATKIIGSVILFFMGINLIFKSLSSKNNTEQNINLLETENINHKNRQIQKPISPFILGIALSIDSIASGLAFSFIKNNIFYLPILTAICQYIFLSLGLFLGIISSHLKIKHNKFIFISGLILVFFSIIKII